jgi:hypothetical protein
MVNNDSEISGSPTLAAAFAEGWEFRNQKSKIRNGSWLVGTPSAFVILSEAKDPCIPAASDSPSFPFYKAARDLRLADVLGAPS